jgi:hypothetical protein
MFYYNCVVVAMLQPQGMIESGVDALTCAVDRLAADDLDGQTVGLGDDIRVLRRCIDRLEAECARRLARFAAAHEHLADSVPSTVGWLRHECGLSAAAAVQRVDVARHLPDLPETWAAFRSGAVGFQNAALVARTAAAVGAEALEQIDGVLARAGSTLAPERMRMVTAHARHCVDPDGSLSDANADHERRWLHLSQTGGVFFLDARLDAEGGAALRTALEACMPPLRDSVLTCAQRRADALVELATRSLNAGDLPTTRGVRPHLTVTAPLATLQRRDGSPGAELVWAGVIPAETARRLACDAAVTHIDVDACGTPLNAGRTTRSIPAPTRRALALRDRGCRFPGCDRPAGWTDAHHIHHWADAGAKTLDNLVLLCRRHHRRVHEEGWALRRNGDGMIEAVPP